MSIIRNTETTDPCRNSRSITAAGVVLCWAVAATAQAHGIAGNRFFPGTVNFDDPAVSDELAVTGGTGEHPVSGGQTTDDRTALSFTRLLRPGLAFVLDTGVTRRDWGGLRRTGASGSDVSLKTRLYENDLNETLAAASLTYGLPGSGAWRVGASVPASWTPGLFVGQGLGTLPEEVSWLRPFALAGAVSAQMPMGSHPESAGFDAGTRQLVDRQSANATTLHWGFAVEYSMLYRTDRFVPGRLPVEEPLHQFVPLVEFAFDSPHGQATRGTANPGIAYVKDTWQVAMEAVLPLSPGAGHGVGANVQVLLFLDNLLPSVFGRPLVSL